MEGEGRGGILPCNGLIYTTFIFDGSKIYQKHLTDISLKFYRGKLFIVLFFNLLMLKASKQMYLYRGKEVGDYKMRFVYLFSTIFFTNTYLHKRKKNYMTIPLPFLDRTQL